MNVMNRFELNLPRCSNILGRCLMTVLSFISKYVSFMLNAVGGNKENEEDFKWSIFSRERKTSAIYCSGRRANTSRNPIFHLLSLIQSETRYVICRVKFLNARSRKITLKHLKCNQICFEKLFASLSPGNLML